MKKPPLTLAPLALVPLAMAAILAACALPRATGNTYGQAAAAAGIAVAGAAINRAVTHECWGNCRPGLVCDRSSGLCVEPGSQAHAPQHDTAYGSPPDRSTPGEVYEIPSMPETDADRSDAAAPEVDAGPARPSQPSPPNPGPFVLRGPTP